jgi:hypothetical protein
LLGQGVLPQRRKPLQPMDPRPQGEIALGAAHAEKALRATV